MLQQISTSTQHFKTKKLSHTAIRIMGLVSLVTLVSFLQSCGPQGYQGSTPITFQENPEKKLEKGVKSIDYGTSQWSEADIHEEDMEAPSSSESSEDDSIFLAAPEEVQDGEGDSESAGIASSSMEENSRRIKHNTDANDDCSNKKAKLSEEKEIWGPGLINLFEKMRDMGLRNFVRSDELPNPENYEYSLKGFDQFLEDIGVEHMTANEVGLPTTIRKMTTTRRNQLGYHHLVPNKACWYRGATLLLTTELLRHKIADNPIRVTSWYRPSAYNKIIGGAKASDHLQAKAMDLSFRTVDQRKIAQEFLCENFWLQDTFKIKPDVFGQKELNISVGFAKTMIHLGLNTAKGKRYWWYKSFAPYTKKANSCWNYKK